MKTNKIILTVLLTILSNSIWANALTIPNSFSAGSSAVAEEINANFTAIKNAVNDNDKQVTSNATAISDLTTAVQGSATATTQSIQTNKTSISSNTTKISDLTTTITNSATATINAIKINTDSIASLVNGIKTLGSATTTTEALTNFGNLLKNHGSRISTLEDENIDGNGNTTTTTIATRVDNPIITVNCANNESLQAAIEQSPLYGKVIIEITGTCVDDIYLRRSLTIRGALGNNSAVITGNASGFSSSEVDNYNYNTSGNGLTNLEVDKDIYAAIEVNGKSLKLENLVVNAGTNNHALRIGNGAKVYLKDVVLNGNNHGARVYNNSILTLKNTTINSNNSITEASCNNLFCGSGIYASLNSSIILKSGNTLNSAANGDNFGLAILSNVSVSLKGGNNNINGLGLFKSSFEQSHFVNNGTGNKINNTLEVCGNSFFFAQKITINVEGIEVCDNSSIILESIANNSISLATESFKIQNNSIVYIESEDGTSYTFDFINKNKLIAIEVESNSSFEYKQGDILPANLRVNTNSRVKLEGTVAGNLDIHGFSSYLTHVSNSIKGNISCGGNVEAFKSDGSSYTDICPSSSN